jgi:acetyltransferase-like isoleucine patch superfamily enzyme
MAMCIHCGQDDCDAGYLCPKAPRGLDQTPESPQYDKTQLEVCHLDSTFISANVEIRRPRIVRIGRHTNVDSGVYCTTAMRLGDYVHLAAYCTIIGGPNGFFEMKHFSTLGAGSRIVCVSDAHPEGSLVGPRIPAHIKDPKHVVAAPVIFEPMAIGTTQIVVLPGVTLGMGCFVAAGAVVTKSVDPWTVVAGVPARPIKERSKEARQKMLEAAKRLGYEFWSHT